MRYLLPLLLWLNCQPNEPTPAREVQTLTGLLRYEQRDSVLTAQLTLPDSTGQIPRLGQERMIASPGASGRKFTLEQKRAFAPALRYTIPNQGDTVEFTLHVNTVFIDSLPAVLYRDSTARFPVAAQGLLENESLVIAFQPSDGSRNDKRILITGPTGSGTITLPPTTLDDIPEGEYRVYLFKQQLYRDRQGYLRADIRVEYVSRATNSIVR